MARKQNYPVVLSEKERQELEQIVKTGRHPARERQRAQTLLWSAAGKTDKEIAELAQDHAVNGCHDPSALGRGEADHG